MKRILLWIWQLPQHLAALVLIKILKAKKRILATDHGFIEWYFYERKNRFSKFISGVSLGEYILLPYGGEAAVKHEYGHSIQSRYWGPLYLLAAGLPSAVFNNLWDRLAHKNWSYKKRHKWYYGRYPEKQADALGGVVWENGERVCKG